MEKSVEDPEKDEDVGESEESGDDGRVARVANEDISVEGKAVIVGGEGGDFNGMIDMPPLVALDLERAREGKGIRVRGVAGGEMSTSL